MESFSLTADMMYVASNAPRIGRALFEIAARNRWSGAAELLLKLCKVRHAALGSHSIMSVCFRRGMIRSSDNDNNIATGYPRSQPQPYVVH